MDSRVVLRLTVDDLKERTKNFGVKTVSEASISPNPDIASRYTQKPCLNKGVQAILTTLSAHEVNTKERRYESRGINHQEGGWPKDVNPADPELVGRFRKRVEKDDFYISSVLKLAKETEAQIRQNITIDIYEEYFDDDDEATLADLEIIRPVSAEDNDSDEQSNDEADEISR